MTIHPTAIVEDGAVIGDDVTIGPFCVVGPDVTLGDRVELISHATARELYQVVYDQNTLVVDVQATDTARSAASAIRRCSPQRSSDSATIKPPRNR